MSLHPPVLFLGDRPNPKTNLSLDVPFVGTKSYKILLEWIYRMDLDVNNIKIANTVGADGHVNWINPPPLFRPDYKPKIITLGQNAKEWLKDIKKRHDLSWVTSFNLPHPSGLNRELNDKKALSDLLVKCRAFIYKK